MEKPSFYITTTLPYVNSEPHIGFAMEIIRADTIARWKRSKGYDVFFNTGTDEHGAKILENANKENQNVQDYVDFYASKFRQLTDDLHISDINFIRTTDNNHVLAAQHIWQLCDKNGYIYKKNYKAKYCVGCELYKTDSELVDGKCEWHPNKDIQLIDEENYFFAWSKFSGRGHKDSLLDYYDNNTTFVVPDFRYNDIKAFVGRGLEDFSISRLKSKMPWGVEVPGDSDHVMYVWFDALTSYISTLGWPDDAKFDKYWQQSRETERNVIQYCGKDNLRQQSAMWQAMLMAAGLPNSTQIIIDGFIVSGGQKMSKSLGNVISPGQVIDIYREATPFAVEVLKFMLLHEVPSFEDGDLTALSMSMAYTGHLQNGIGNQVNRILKLSSQYVSADEMKSIMEQIERSTIDENFDKLMNEYKVNEAIRWITNRVGELDSYIQMMEPFKLVKDENRINEGKDIIINCLYRLADISHHLYYFMPETAMYIYNHIKDNKMPEKPMFNRLG